MITTNHQVATGVPSKVYKLFSKALGPPDVIKHFREDTFFAEFGPFTLYSVADCSGGILVSVNYHIFTDETKDVSNTDKTHRRILKRIATYSGKHIDTLDPFN